MPTSGTTFAMGRYVKTNESQMSDAAADHPGVGRAATYQWQEEGE